MAWLRREDLEDLELRHLGRWAARSREPDCRRRRLSEPEDPLRTAFQRDRDRIIHSSAFRRLQHKTQVLAAYEGDHYRTRMTHTLEVSQMARSVALALRLNADLAEAVSLAHDLGHPPFGHAGERTLDERMSAQGGFRHNAQGARIVDYLEDRYGHGHGLNLTLATRRSLLKGRVPDGFPLSSDLGAAASLSLEAQVVDHCDRIAYLCHDLDDGLRAAVLEEREVQELRLWQAGRQAADARGRHRVISEITALMIHDLVESGATALARSGNGPPRLQHGAEMRVLCDELLALLRERFYRSPTVLTAMQRGSDRIRSLFEQLVADPDKLPERARARIAADGLERAVCDYIAGMTDRFLLKQR